MLSAVILLTSVFVGGVISFAEDVTYGTKGNPVCEGDSTPIVVQGADVTFPDGMSVKDTATFTGAATGMVAVSGSTSVSYSSADGTYYKSNAGSVAAKLLTAGVRYNKQDRSAIQLSVTNAYNAVLAANITTSSYAFWINAPEDMYVTVQLFAYRHSGTSGDINFYSSDVEVKKGANLVEIPLSNFTVSSNNSIDFTKNLTIYSTKIYFRKLESGNAIVGKTVYIDQLGFYAEKNTLGDYISLAGSKGYPVVDSENKEPLVIQNASAAFPDGMDIKDDAKFTGSVSGFKGVGTNTTTTVVYNSSLGNYYGDTAGSAAITLGTTFSYNKKTYIGAQFGALKAITAANAANSSVAFWINAPEDMYVMVHLFAYKHSGTSGDINFYSTDIEVKKGANFVEIPLANFTVASANSVDATKNLSIYATRFCFMPLENGESISGKSVYIDNIGIYSSMNTQSDYLKNADNYISFSKFSSWELESAPTVMPETIEVWFNIDPNNTANTLSLFGNYGRNNSYIPSIELWLGRKQNSETGDYYYLPRLEYYNVKDWGFDARAKAYYLNSCVIKADCWNHLVVTRDAEAGKLYCYLNNTLVQTVTNTALRFADFVTEDTYAVGGRLSTPNNTYFNGDIASVSVYSDTRTAKEISDSYTATATSKNLTEAVAANDSALICSYNLFAAAGCERIENAKAGGVALAENMWVESSDPTDYAYSFAVVGDTQKTAEYDVLNNKNYTAGIYNYINDNATNKKIAHVFGLGDITDDSRKEEWEMVRENTDALTVPYSMITGNHDPEGDFNTYYGAGTPYASQVAGHFGNDYTHTYHTFTAGSVKYLVVALGWDPSDDVLEWANGVIDAHPNHSVIVTTHAYLFRDGERMKKENGTMKFNDGEDIWNKLVKLHKNIVLVLGGHDVSDRIMMKQSMGDKGNTVTELLINPQGMDEGLAKAGDIPTAMIAMLYFSNDGKTVSIRYYSTSKNTYFKANNQFSFSLESNIGKKGYPVVNNQKNKPIVVQGETKLFPGGMQINGNAEFTGTTSGLKAVGSTTTTVSYSETKGTYYNGVAGSAAATLGSTFAYNKKNYAGVQFGALKPIAAANAANSSVAFWINAPEDMYVMVHLFAYRHSGDSGDINFYSSDIKVKKGVNFVEIPLANFTVASANSVDSTKNISIYTTRFCFMPIENGESITGKTVYIDNIGIYNNQNEAADYKAPKPEVEEPKAEGNAVHKDGASVEQSFWQMAEDTVSKLVPIHNSSTGVLESSVVDSKQINEFAAGYTPTWTFEGADSGWKQHSLSSFNISKSNTKAYAGNSLKLTYKKEGAVDAYPRVICSTNQVRISDYDGIAFWVYSDSDLTLACLGVMNNCGKTNQIYQTIKSGAQLVILPFEEFSNYAAFKGDAKTITQFQFMGVNLTADATLYIDHVGFYKAEDMQAVNENAYGGMGKSVKIATKDGVKTSSDFTYRFDINFKSTLTDVYKNKWEDEATLAIWIKTNRAFKVKVGAGASKAWNPETGENHWFSDIHTVPAGESILRIPLSELKNKQGGWSYTTETPDWSQYIGRLIFQVTTLNDVELEMFVDQIALEYPEKIIEVTPEYHDKDTFIWWNFDKESGDDWTTRWAGDTGEGIKLELEKNVTNVYGGKGQSLKLNYDSAFAEWGIPVLWHEDQMSVYGDGISFWFKSLEAMEIDIYCALVVEGYDSWPIAKVTGIPVKYGENIISVKYEDFVLDSKDGGEVPKFAKIAQLQIRLKKASSGTAWVDSIGFTGVTDDGSNSYKYLNPPASYKNYEKGAASSKTDFEDAKIDDLEFTTDWYFEDTGKITLEKDNGNTQLRMDFDMSEKKSVLKNITQYDGIDATGGISFWMKSSENRNYALSLTIGGTNVTVIIKGNTKGQYYYIPFSAFWNSKDIEKSFAPASKALVSVTRIEFATDSTVNPPALGTSSKCSIWLDDITFTDSLGYKRAEAVDHYENGVRLIAAADAFASGVEPSVSVATLTDEQKTAYLSAMKGVKEIIAEYHIKAIDVNSVEAIPSRQVELVFDIPEGYEAAGLSVWQTYFDGSAVRSKATVGEDGKLHVSTYKLGNYILAVDEAKESESQDTEVIPQEEERSFPTVWVIVISAAAVLLIAGGIVLVKVLKKKEGNK